LSAARCWSSPVTSGAAAPVAGGSAVADPLRSVRWNAVDPVAAVAPLAPFPLAGDLAAAAAAAFAAAIEAFNDGVAASAGVAVVVWVGAVVVTAGAAGAAGAVSALISSS